MATTWQTNPLGEAKNFIANLNNRLKTLTSGIMSSSSGSTTPLAMNQFIRERQTLEADLAEIENLKSKGLWPSGYDIPADVQQMITTAKTTIPPNVVPSLRSGNQLTSTELSQLKQFGYGDQALQELQTSMPTRRESLNPADYKTVDLSNVPVDPNTITFGNNNQQQQYTIIDPKTGMVKLPNGTSQTIAQYQANGGVVPPNITGTTKIPSGGATGMAGSTGSTSSQGGISSGGMSGGISAAAQAQNLQKALDVIGGSSLDEGTKSLFKQVVQQWNPNSEINFDNILKTFDDISKKTIDPEFAERTKVVMDDITRARDFMQGEFTKEQEAEKMQRVQNVDNAKADLEARGMTFSGQGIKQLGGQSAFAQEGTSAANKSAVPVQQAFGGQFQEGNVIKQNRLMSSSSDARRQKQLQDLQRAAEQQLGSNATQGIIPGVSQLGGITGSLQKEKEAAKAGVLSNLYSQEQQNVQARTPLNVL